MVTWIFCECGRVIDEYEQKCYWCGAVPKEDSIEKEDLVVEKQLMLFDEHID